MGAKTIKKNRPCIFLFEQTESETSYAYIMPLTSSVKKFNEDCDRFIFIPEVIYKYKTLSFAKVDGIIRIPMEQLRTEGIILTNDTIIFLFRKIREFVQKRKATTNLKQTADILQNINQRISSEQAKIAQEKKAKRKRKNYTKREK